MIQRNSSAVMCHDSSDSLTPEIFFYPEPAVHTFFSVLMLFEKLSGLHGAALNISECFSSITL